MPRFPQPRRIPLTFAWIAFRFSTHRGSLYLLCIYIYFLSFSLLFFISPFSTKHSCFPFFLSFRDGYMRGSNCFILPLSLLVNINLSIIVIVSPKNKEMDPTGFTELLKCLSPLGVQWVVEWWHITDMVNRGFKDNCVPLIEL